MFGFDLITCVFICFAALLAGFMDSAVGGGGMITIPTLFTVFPKDLPATLLGTNKVAALGGMTMAAGQFARKVAIQWQWVIPAMLAAGLASALGAFSATYIPVLFFKRFLPPVLMCLLIYTVFSKQLIIEKTVDTEQSIWPGVVFSAACGFYDGVFGPGAGSFLVLLWVRVYGLSFIQASAHAKWVNVASCLTSLILFATTTPLYIGVGLMMTAFGGAGAYLGTWATMKYGNVFLRKLMIVVVMALIARTSYDAYLR